MTNTLPSPARVSATIDLSSARLRSNPAWELVLFDRLTASERQALRGLTEDPDCYGVLRSRRDSGLSMKAVSRDTALLLFSMQQTGPLPRFASQMLGDDCAATIGRMLLDGILEVEINGAMISGPQAAALIYGTAHATGSDTSLAALSHRAIHYAESLRLDDPFELSSRLYSYNTIPASARWRALLPGEAATAQYLGLHHGPAARALASDWRPVPETKNWISHRANAADHSQPPTSAPSLTYKLYVSPACDHVRDAVEAIAEAVAQSKALQWKVGKGVHGLVRPDKMVIYFRQFADLQEVARKIMDRLEGCPPHGVPFTAELAGGGLLSWGIDPPRETGSLSWLGGESWRGKLCNKLAMALVQAGISNHHEETRKAGDSSQPPYAANFAIQRLRLEGIDTDTWTPTHGFVWAS